MSTERSSALRTALFRLGLLGLAKRGRDLLWAARAVRANFPYLTHGSPDGLPIPPSSLRILVAGSPDIAWFLDSGRRGAGSIRTLLERNGLALDRSGPLLDFGCGCGRVVRHFGASGVAIHGTDLNPALVTWCRRHLLIGAFVTNALDPPLAFDDGRFGLVYALSVFTHLSEPLQFAWMQELRRVLRPGGHLVFSTHGTGHVAELGPEDRERFAAGQLVLRRADRQGTNVCGAYHPEAYVRERLARGFSIVDFVPEGASGNPRQDLWLLQRA